MDNLTYYYVNFSNKINAFDKCESEGLVKRMAVSFDGYPASYAAINNVKEENIKVKKFFHTDYRKVYNPLLVICQRISEDSSSDSYNRFLDVITSDIYAYSPSLNDISQDIQVNDMHKIDDDIVNLTLSKLTSDDIKRYKTNIAFIKKVYMETYTHYINSQRQKEIEFANTVEKIKKMEQK